MTTTTPETPPQDPQFVLVLDVEATCLDPYADHAALLEVGFVLCRGLGLDDIAHGEQVLRPPGTEADHNVMWSKMSPLVQEMHGASGLWREATAAEPLAPSPWEFDAAMVDWLNDTCGPETRIFLAGSGVSHYDDRWMRVYLPRLRDRLAHATLDAGVIRRCLQHIGRHDLVDLATDVDAKPHRGLADARLHLDELRRYFSLILAIPATPSVSQADAASS